MHKAATLGIVAALGMSGAAVAADDVSHTYVEAGYGYGELAGGIVTGSGLRVAGSLELPSNFIAAASYRDFSFKDDFDADISELSAGVGYKWALGDAFDLVTGASFEQVKIEGESESGFGLSVVATGHLTGTLQVSAGLSYLDLGGEIPSTYGMSLGVRHYFTPAFSAGLDVRKAEPLVFAGETSFIAMLRYDFGKVF